MEHVARMDFVEEFAHALAAGGGLSRTAGRILAFLLTDDQPHRSLQELTHELDVSKGSISTNTRVLIAQRMIRSVPVQGSRMEHYGLVPGGLLMAMSSAAEASRGVAALAAQGLSLMGGVVTPSTSALRDVEDSYTRLADAIESILAEKLPVAQ